MRLVTVAVALQLGAFLEHVGHLHYEQVGTGYRGFLWLLIREIAHYPVTVELFLGWGVHEELTVGL